MKTRKTKWSAITATLVVGVTLLMCLTSFQKPEKSKKTETSDSVSISEQTPIVSKGTVGTEEKNINIGGKEYPKTTEAVIIAKGTTATIQNSNNEEGAFSKNRKVKLSAFSMGKYEVTQELYEDITGLNPSVFRESPADSEIQELRPVDNVTWYDAVAFCNQLTRYTMKESDCVYTITILERSEYTASITKAQVQANYSKKGYRLPTEAEWEFAARGGRSYI